MKWNGFFFDKECVCLNFELLDHNLRQYLHDRDYKGLNMAELRPVIQQLATALNHLSSVGLIHADLKPDDVMIVNSGQQPLKVRLIGFGLACPVSSVQQGDSAQTTWYRTQEVMLHVPFNEAIDMWSLGLVAAELATGYALYRGHWDYDVLSCINSVQGLPPDHVLQHGRLTLYYCQQRNGQWTLKTPETFGRETGYYARTSFAMLDSHDEVKEMMGNARQHQNDRHLLMDLIDAPPRP